MSPLRLAAALSSVAVLGCGGSYPKTPEEALPRIEQAVVAADSNQAWALVDPATRAAVESVLSDERLMQTIVKAKYPPAEAARELERLKGADEPNAQHFFAATCARWHLIEGYRKRLGSVSGPIQTKSDGPDSVWVARSDGMPFHLVKSGSGWAWADLRGEWDLEKDRASHAVKTVRDNAALYKKTENQ